MTNSLTVAYIESKFDEFNALMFEGALPKIPVALSNAVSYVGLCTYKTRKRLFGKPEYYDFKLRISTRFDLTEAEVEDTIIHEMIHYYIKLNGIRDTSAHGKVFRQMMNGINDNFGRHITISHHSTKEQREALIDKRPKEHIVAIVSFKDGRQGVKLLPRIPRSITSYHRVVGSNPKVAGIEYFIENDPWFNRFPTSSAFNVVYAPMEEVHAHLSGKSPITVTRRGVIFSE